MSRRFLKIGCFAVILAAVGVAFWVRRKPEPEQQGHPLSYWLRQITMYPAAEGPRDTAEALKAFGPPAAHELVRILAQNDSPPRRRWYAGLYSQLPASVKRLLPRVKVPAAAVRLRAAGILLLMGSGAREELPALIRLLDHPDKEVRIWAVNIIVGLGPDGKPAIPVLSEQMHKASDAGLSNVLCRAIMLIESGHQPGT